MWSSSIRISDGRRGGARKMKKSIALAAIIAVCAGAGIRAQQMVTYADRSGTFSLIYPESWTVEPDRDDVNLTLSAPDRSAMVQVMARDMGVCMTAAALLRAMERQLGFVNLLPASRQKPAGAYAAGTDDALGTYRVSGGGPWYPALQSITVLVKGKRAYIIVQTIRERMKTIHGSVAGDIVQSFRILK